MPNNKSKFFGLVSTKFEGRVLDFDCVSAELSFRLGEIEEVWLLTSLEDIALDMEEQGVSVDHLPTITDAIIHAIEDYMKDQI